MEEVKTPVIPSKQDLAKILRGVGVSTAKSCGICGKPESRNTKDVKENCPTHARAEKEDWAGIIKRLEKAMGSNVLDFVQRRKFNGQLVWLQDQLKIARAEHDKFAPDMPEESQKRRMVALLTEGLALLGEKDLGKPSDPKLKGEWRPLDLCEALVGKLKTLMAIGAEAWDVKNDPTKYPPTEIEIENADPV